MVTVSSAAPAVISTPETVVVPLAATPAQDVAITLGGQACQIAVYQKRTGLYLDLSVANRAIVTGALCLDRNVLVISEYLAFAGDLTFYDTQGAQDPTYDGLGSRFVLLWVAPA